MFEEGLDPSNSAQNPSIKPLRFSTGQLKKDSGFRQLAFSTFALIVLLFFNFVDAVCGSSLTIGSEGGGGGGGGRGFEAALASLLAAFCVLEGFLNIFALRPMVNG